MPEPFSFNRLYPWLVYSDKISESSLISHSHQAIFVHIPKSAGTSMGTSLNLYDDKESWGMQDHRPIKQCLHLNEYSSRQLLRPDNFNLTYYYVRNRWLDKSEFVTQQQFDSYFKFTFVRNSWGRVFSWYCNIMNDSRHKKNYNIPDNASFAWFVNNRLDTLKEQLYYITDVDNNVIVDFVGRFETLSADFQFVCEKLKLADNILPRKNSEGAPGYIEHYTDELIEIVGLHYKKDITYFEFEFGT